MTVAERLAAVLAVDDREGSLYSDIVALARENLDVVGQAMLANIEYRDRIAIGLMDLGTDEGHKYLLTAFRRAETGRCDTLLYALSESGIPDSDLPRLVGLALGSYGARVSALSVLEWTDLDAVPNETWAECQRLIAAHVKGLATSGKHDECIENLSDLFDVPCPPYDPQQNQ